MTSKRNCNTHTSMGGPEKVLDFGAFWAATGRYRAPNAVYRDLKGFWTVGSFELGCPACVHPPCLPFVVGHRPRLSMNSPSACPGRALAPHARLPMRLDRLPLWDGVNIPASQSLRPSPTCANSAGRNTRRSAPRSRDPALSRSAWK